MVIFQMIDQIMVNREDRLQDRGIKIAKQYKNIDSMLRSNFQSIYMKSSS